MEKKHTDLLTSNYVYLVNKLDMPELIDHMYQTKLLSDNDKERLKAIQQVIFVPALFCFLVYCCRCVTSVAVA